MKNIIFEPWIGDNYQNGGIFGKKILVVGESCYCDEEEATADITTRIVRNYLDIRQGNYNQTKGGWINTYLKFERSLVNRETSLIDSINIWHSIAFYNYLQVPMDGAREAGTWQDYVQAQPAFLEVLNHLRPEYVIVWGVGRLYDALPNKNWEHGQPINIDGYALKNGNYKLETGDICKVVFVYHPSTGYSWDWWHQAINKIINF